MIGTLLITDEADFILIPGNAPRFVDMSDTYLEEAFLFDGKISDRFGGTNPTTKISEFFTVADSGNESRSVKTCQACFQKGGLKSIVIGSLFSCRTDLFNPNF
jgi:hypothetical protein